MMEVYIFLMAMSFENKSQVFRYLSQFRPNNNTSHSKYLPAALTFNYCMQRVTGINTYRVKMLSTQVFAKRTICLSVESF